MVLGQEKEYGGDKSVNGNQKDILDICRPSYIIRCQPPCRQYILEVYLLVLNRRARLRTPVQIWKYLKYEYRIPYETCNINLNLTNVWPIMFPKYEMRNLIDYNNYFGNYIDAIIHALESRLNVVDITHNVWTCHSVN